LDHGDPDRLARRGGALDSAPQGARESALARAPRPHRAGERIVAEIERRVAAEKGVVLPAPQPVAPEQTGTGSYKEIFGPRYRTRTLLLSNQSLTAAKERPG
jgi:hypothetical protein